MSVMSLFWGILLVIVIPLAEGALLALLLRDVYIRHPLPLGGTIVPRWWNPPKPAVKATESAQRQLYHNRNQDLTDAHFREPDQNNRD